MITTNRNIKSLFIAQTGTDRRKNESIESTLKKKLKEIQFWFYFMGFDLSKWFLERNSGGLTALPLHLLSIFWSLGVSSSAVTRVAKMFADLRVWQKFSFKLQTS